ncbi:MAG: MobF family relaxase, partial [Acidimicrobiales bacterium]
MSVGRIGAGDGYRYLTDQVASHDASRQGERLLGYYDRVGMPEGIWWGRGAESFGLTGTVTEEPMEHLYGRCSDPNTGDQLGRRMAIYKTTDERVAERVGSLGHEATEAEREAIAAEEEAKGTPQAVAGFDLTFSAPKSVSVAWALGDESLRAGLRDAHEAAWRSAMEYFQEAVAMTRVGRAGVAQVEVEGVTAAAFEHWFARSGDPQLHTHVAVSAMVRTTRDHRWRRLDSRALYRAAASAGEVYTATLMTEASERAGVGWRHRSSGRSETLLPEIAGVSDAAIAAFSTRSAQVEANLARLVGDYQDHHGYAPDRATTARLAQVATLSERPEAAPHVWADEHPGWVARAAEVLGCEPDQVTEQITGAVRVQARELPELPMGGVEVQAQAEAVLARLVDGGATWIGRDIHRQATAQVREAGYAPSPEATKAVVEAVMAHPDLVAIAVPEVAPVPEALRRRDGESIFTRSGEARFTSTVVLQAEAALAALAARRDLEAPEAARRAQSPYGGIDDAALGSRVVLAGERLGVLATRIAASEAEEARDSAEESAATEEAARVRASLPATTAARAGMAGEDDAASEVASIRGRLSRKGRFGPGPGVRAGLVAEIDEISARYPRARLSPTGRAAGQAQALEDARVRDDVAVEMAEARAGAARRRAEQARGSLGVLRAQESEQAEGKDALVAELAAREATPERVEVAGHLAGLGADQAGAVVRLADPSRTLDALIGPAGAGKTTALAALVAAFTGAGREVQVLAPT